MKAWLLVMGILGVMNGATVAQAEPYSLLLKWDAAAAYPVVSGSYYNHCLYKSSPPGSPRVNIACGYTTYLQQVVTLDPVVNNTPICYSVNTVLINGATGEQTVSENANTWRDPSARELCLGPSGPHYLGNLRTE